MKRENELYKKGKRIYRRLSSILIKKYKGKIIAIDGESEKYVIGEDELDVALEAKKLFPGKRVNFFRIGYSAVHKFRVNPVRKDGAF